jgi:hypothetical protein
MISGEELHIAGHLALGEKRAYHRDTRQPHRGHGETHDRATTKGDAQRGDWPDERAASADAHVGRRGALHANPAAGNRACHR